jgi:hypothetical protein
MTLPGPSARPSASAPTRAPTRALACSRAGAAAGSGRWHVAGPTTLRRRSPLRTLTRRQRLAALLRRHRVPPLPHGGIVEPRAALAEGILHPLAGTGPELVEVTAQHLVMTRARGRLRHRGDRPAKDSGKEKETAVHPGTPSSSDGRGRLGTGDAFA